MSDKIYQIERNIRTIWANPENPSGTKGQGATSFNGRKGSPCLRNFRPGETRILVQASGCGIIRHIWITIENRDKPQTLKGYLLECYWDDCEKAAVSVPLGDFFCFNSGKLYPMENEFFSNPEGRSFNCYIPMPFKTGMKITITNQTKSIEEIQLFYQIDYTLGDEVNDAMYFHAFYNRECYTTAKQDYVIIPKFSGCGRYLGASFSFIGNPLMVNSWWGEGEIKCYIDGDDEYPTLAGTGTEDYIGTGWGQGSFINRYQGCGYADPLLHRYSFYRFHVCDPVYFTQDIKITIQQIGNSLPEDLNKMLDNGLDIYRTDGLKIQYGNEGAVFERFGDDWCSIAYFYLENPSSTLPEPPPYIDRIHNYQ